MRKRNCCVFLRFTEDEKEKFETAFEKSGFKKRNDFVLYLLNNVKVINFSYDFSVLNNVRDSLNGAGNNINQIAKRINTIGYYDKYDMQMLRDMKEKIEESQEELSVIRKFLPKTIGVKK